MMLSLAFTFVSPLLALSSPAQQAVPFQKPQLRGGTGDAPVERVLHVTYDAQLQRVRSVRSASAGELGLGSAPCYDNSEIVLPEDPQYAVANPGEELLNWGSKLCPGASRLRKFTIAYRSEADDTSIGGPGAAFSIALHTGTTGFGTTGTEVFRGTFTGMPSNGAPESPTVTYGPPFLTGPAPMVFFTVDFGTEPLPLNDGPIGWSFLQLDGDTGPVLVRAPKAVLGTIDAMDVYSPGPPTPASYTGTFNYGGCAGTSFRACANMYIQLDEILNSEVARTDVLDGTGVNPSILREILPARIGHVWAARMHVAQPPIGNPPFSLLFASRADLPTPAPSPIGEILIDPAQRISAPSLAEGTYTFAIPADTALVGFRLFVQGAVLPPATPAPFLTNALRIRVGF